jgi:acyl transferase domain-containing protein/acyl carrier protein
MSETAIDTKNISPLKRALKAVREMSAKLEAIERSSREPIAIIGMSCRFPGHADTPEKFWQLLRDGKDAITEFPSDRWDVDAYYNADPDTVGKMYTRWGGILEEIDKFDPQFFGISPREAMSMDPQQRLLLEVSWEALERAGQDPRKLAGTQTGVFIGICAADYGNLLSQSRDPSLIDAYTGTGVAFSAAAGRISYVLGLQGPSVAMDTACSSSLVAVHMACQNLRTRKCSMALVGGTNLILLPETNVYLSRVKAISPDGRCKTFDAAADGYGRGEGCAMIVLKRLSDALANNDPILAMIRGSAVNHDGRTSGLTVPSSRAQQAVIREALTNACVEPLQVTYIEAHGTGTPLGDPIELESIAAVLCNGRAKEKKLLVGSVKTNIGHLEGAAGIAGLIKVVLALQHQEIPPHLHLKQLNPRFAWEKELIEVPISCTPWVVEHGSRITGVSSFGFSGTNAHIIVEEAPPHENKTTEYRKLQINHDRPVHLLSLSATNEKSLRELAVRFEKHLGDETNTSLADICYTTNTGRSDFDHRIALVCGSHKQLREFLSAVAVGQVVSGMHQGVVQSAERQKVAFLFAGQGSQYPGMGQQFYTTQPVFRKALDRCNELLHPFLQQPLISALYSYNSLGSLMDETPYAQAALFAFEYALAALWLSWGIVPSVVMGIDIGEYVAACIAGVFSLEDGIKLVAEHTRLDQSMSHGGAMRTASANPILESFEKATSEVKYSAPRISFVCSANGRLAMDGEVTHASYWRRSVPESVQFHGAIQTLLRQGYKLFVEIGPSSILSDMGEECAGEEKVIWLPSLRKGRDDWSQILESLGALYAHGVEVDWEGLDRGHPRQKVILPTYPFQRERYWIAETIPSQPKIGAPPAVWGQPLHPLLGCRLRTALKEILFESRISLNSAPLLNDHRIYGKVVVPGSFHVSLMLSAAKEVFGGEPYVLQDVSFPQPIVLQEDESRIVQIILSPGDSGQFSFEIFSFADSAKEEKEWTLHASGKISSNITHPTALRSLPILVEELQSRCQENSSYGEVFYQKVRVAGLQLGPSFQWIGKVWEGKGETLGCMQQPAAIHDVTLFQVHPGLIDSCFQLIGAALPAGLIDETVYVPVGFHTSRFNSSSDSSLWCHVRLRPVGELNREVIRADFHLFSENRKTVAVIEDVYFKRAPREALLRPVSDQLRDRLYAIEWKPLLRMANEPLQQPEPYNQPGKWLIFADRQGKGVTLARQLEGRGETCSLIFQKNSHPIVRDDYYEVDPMDPEDIYRIIGEILGNDWSSCRGIVHLWSLNSISSEPLTVSSLNSAQIIGCKVVLSLVQWLAANVRSISPRLWIVTRGAQAVKGELVPVSVAQSPLWGLGRVIALEHPGLWGGLVDLDPSGSEDDLSMLAEEIFKPVMEDHLAFRQGQRYVARLVHHEVQNIPVGPLTLTPEGTYLITGGLGALGIEAGRRMAERGARNLVLVGRSSTSRNAKEVIDQMVNSGVRVEVINGDVSQEEEVTRILAQIHQSMPPLRGIIHAAGIVDDGVLLQQDWSRFEKVLAPKIHGAWILHKLTREIDLDFFVLFSSAASLLGNSGQGNYAAANAFLDGLAHHRLQQGLPAVSINWGPWSDIGMAASFESREKNRIGSHGSTFIGREQGLHILEKILQLSTDKKVGTGAQIGILPINWQKFRRSNPMATKLPLLSSITGKEIESDEEQTKYDLTLETLLAAEPGERRMIVEAYLAKQLAKVLKLPSSSLDSNQSISTMGFDSLMAVELRNQIERDLKVAIPMVRFLEGPSISRLAGMLLDELTVTGTSPTPSPLRFRERKLTELDDGPIRDSWEEGVL